MSIENKDAVPSSSGSVQAVKVFCCFEPRNIAFWKELEIFLAVLKRSGQIVVSHTQSILVGTEFDEEVSRKIEDADIILLLISHYFFHSDSCWTAMENAMERYKSKGIPVIPILLSPVDYEGAPIDKLQMLPRDKPISQQVDVHQAYVDIVKEMREAIKRSKTKRDEP